MFYSITGGLNETKIECVLSSSGFRADNKDCWGIGIAVYSYLLPTGGVRVVADIHNVTYIRIKIVLN